MGQAGTGAAVIAWRALEAAPAEKGNKWKSMWDERTGSIIEDKNSTTIVYREIIPYCSPIQFFEEEFYQGYTILSYEVLKVL